jgi:CRP-like cAMP-binding protein
MDERDRERRDVKDESRAGGGTSAPMAGTPVTARRLASLAALGPADLRFVSTLKGRTAKAGSLLNADGGGTDGAGLILSGWCARVFSDAAGRWQITGILLPGDGFGLGGAPWAGDVQRVLALSPCVIADPSPLAQVIRLRPPLHAKLIEACQKLAWLEQTYMINHIVRLAGRSAYQRVAHFVSELHMRLSQVDLVSNGAFAMPLSQHVVAEALGLSGVHLNRIARQMKRDGLLDFPRGSVRVPDPARLAEVAGVAA